MSNAQIYDVKFHNFGYIKFYHVKFIYFLNYNP